MYNVTSSACMLNRVYPARHRCVLGGELMGDIDSGDRGALRRGGEPGVNMASVTELE